MISVM